jgi:protein ImuA
MRTEPQESRLSGETIRLSKGLPDQLTKLRRLMAGLAPAPGPKQPLGIAEIDAKLPGGGLAIAALHEIAPADFRSIPAAWGFLLAVTRSLAAARPGALFWPLLPQQGRSFGLPYGAGLKSFGHDPGRFLFARCAKREDALWAMEEALHLGGLGAVIGQRPLNLTLTSSRRLQLAAEASATPILLLRCPRDDTISAARSIWRVASLPAARDRFGLMTCPRWHVALTRTRGGGVGEWMVEWDHDALCLRLASAMADRAPSAGFAQKRA